MVLCLAAVAGGKDLKFERKRMDQVNIIVCTPGRLLQHMDENPLFSADSLQVQPLSRPAIPCDPSAYRETRPARSFLP